MLGIGKPARRRLVLGLTFAGMLSAIFGMTRLPAQAEANQVVIADQIGLLYLPLRIVVEQKLIEKHAKAAGVDAKTLADMHAAYTMSAKLEWMFWDSAYRLETWPV